MKIKHYILSLSSIPLVIIYNISSIILYINGKPISQDNFFKNIFFSMIYEDSFNKEQTSTVLLISGLMIPVVFSLLFGSFIYSDIHTSSTYCFVRQRDRKKWYITKLLNLATLSAIFTLFQIIIPFLIAISSSGENITREKLLTLFFTYTSMFMYTLIITLLINIIAIFLGSAISFIIVYSFTIILFYLTIKIDNVVLFGIKIDFSIINIADNTIVAWKKNSYQLLISAIVNCIYMFVISFCGYIVIKRLDVGINDRENIV